MIASDLAMRNILRCEEKVQLVKCPVAMDASLAGSGSAIAAPDYVQIGPQQDQIIAVNLRAFLSCTSNIVNGAP
jgi:hypothetical protein